MLFATYIYKQLEFWDYIWAGINPWTFSVGVQTGKKNVACVQEWEESYFQQL